MKIKLYIILFLFTFFSCRKDDQVNNDANSYPYNYTIYNAYVKGVVYDSLTGLVVADAPIRGFGMNNSANPSLDTTDQNGRYSVLFWWDNHHYTFQSGQILQVYTHVGNTIGYINFLSDSLRSKDTIHFNLYTLPQSYIKLHIKDTSSSTNFRLTYSMQQYFPDLNSYFIYNSASATDTTILTDALPDRTALIRWGYDKNSVNVKDSLSIYIQSNDSAFVEIIY